ncbi:MAG: hypothetical protein H6816_04130 [Phycisphaerales bacterium]|nr:hypothetical protein [Phycisphaerales bacterium]
MFTLFLIAVSACPGAERPVQAEAPFGGVDVAGDVVLWEREQSSDARILDLATMRDAQGIVHVVFYVYTTTNCPDGKGTLLHAMLEGRKSLDEQHPRKEVLAESCGGSEEIAKWAMTRYQTSVLIVWREKPGTYCMAMRPGEQNAESRRVRVASPLDRITPLGYLEQSNSLILAGPVPSTSNMKEGMEDYAWAAFAQVHCQSNGLLAVTAAPEAEIVSSVDCILRGEGEIAKYVRPVVLVREQCASVFTAASTQPPTPGFVILEHELTGSPVEHKLLGQWETSGPVQWLKAFSTGQGRRYVVVWGVDGDEDVAPTYFVDTGTSVSAQTLGAARDQRCGRPVGAFRESPAGAEGVVVWNDENSELVGMRYSKGTWSALHQFGMQASERLGIEEVEQGRYWVFTFWHGMLKVTELRISAPSNHR